MLLIEVLLEMNPGWDEKSFMRQNPNSPLGKLLQRLTILIVINMHLKFTFKFYSLVSKCGSICVCVCIIYLIYYFEASPLKIKVSQHWVIYGSMVKGHGILGRGEEILRIILSSPEERGEKKNKKEHFLLGSTSARPHICRLLKFTKVQWECYC